MSDAEDVRSRSRERDRGMRGGKSGKNSERSRSRERGDRKHGVKHRILVSNISYQCDWKVIKDLFNAQVGGVAFVDLFVDENQKSRGIGVVEFKDEKSMKKALEVMQRYECKGRKLSLRDDSDNKRDKYGNVVNNRRDRSNLPDLRDEMFPRSNNIPSLLSMSAPPAGPSTTNESWGDTYGLSPKFLESLDINGPLVHRVFVTNLDYNVDEKKLTEVFKLAGKVLNVDLNRDREGKSRGYAVIEYDHPVESVQAISMLNNQQLFERRLIVRMDRDKFEGVLKLPEGLKSVGLGLGVNGEPLRDIGRNIASNANNNQPDNLNSNNSLLESIPNQFPPNLNPTAAAAAAVALNSVVNNNSNLMSLASSQAAALQASLASVSGLTNPLIANSLSSVANELNLANLSGAGLNNSLMNSSMNQSQPFNQSSFSSVNSGNLNFPSRSVDSSGSSGNFNSNYKTTHTDRSNRDSFLNRGGGDYDQTEGNRLYSPKEETDFRQSSIYNQNNNGSQNRNQPSQRNDTIIINNLPPSVTWNSVRDKFKNFGDIINCEMRGIDCALIRFADPRCAEYAIRNMDCARFDGRTIDVRYF